jgi:hypothetical protein
VGDNNILFESAAVRLEKKKTKPVTIEGVRDPLQPLMLNSRETADFAVRLLLTNLPCSGSQSSPGHSKGSKLLLKRWESGKGEKQKERQASILIDRYSRPRQSPPSKELRTRGDTRTFASDPRSPNRTTFCCPAQGTIEPCAMRTPATM